VEDVSDEEREWHLFGQRLDPIVNQVLEAEDPWDAYHAATGLSSEILDRLGWMPHGWPSLSNATATSGARPTLVLSSLQTLTGDVI
jgi:hypothetical protein